jgi:epoxyqueuosine reductase
VDARECISYLTIEHRGEIAPERESKMQDWLFGCDVCQEVCPFNTVRPGQPGRAPVLTMEDFRARPWPPIEEIANLTPEAWDTLTAGSPVRRAGYDGLRRHARRVLRSRV